MRNFTSLLLILVPSFSFGQAKEKFSIAFQLTPELTFHQNKYSNTRDTYTVSTFNCGGQVLLQYDLTKSLFFQGGLGYIPRTINSTVFFNHSAIPPPRQSFTEELTYAPQVSYRSLQLPLIIGYNLEVTTKTKIYLNGGIVGNFLLDAYYDTSKQYEGTYEKKVWQGHSIQLGAGLDFVIFKTVWMTTGSSYSIVNTVKKDTYLYGKGSHDDGVALTHSYLNLWIGVKIPLKS